MGPIEEALIETFFPMVSFFGGGGGGVNTNLQKIIGHTVKCDGLGISDPRSSAKISYITSKAACGGMLGSLLGGTDLNYIGHRTCMRR